MADDEVRSVVCRAARVAPVSLRAVVGDNRACAHGLQFAHTPPGVCLAGYRVARQPQRSLRPAHAAAMVPAAPISQWPRPVAAARQLRPAHRRRCRRGTLRWWRSTRVSGRKEAPRSLLLAIVDSATRVPSHELPGACHDPAELRAQGASRISALTKGALRMWRCLARCGVVWCPPPRPCCRCRPHPDRRPRTAASLCSPALLRRRERGADRARQRGPGCVQGPRSEDEGSGTRSIAAHGS